MSSLMNLQLSFFHNNHIEPNINIIDNLGKELNSINSSFSFLPSIITSHNINFDTGKVNSINNISFITQNRMSQIVFLDNRIDILINNNNRDNDIFEKYTNICVQALSKITQTLKLNSNRLSLNINLISNNLKEDELETKLKGKQCCLLSFYTNTPLVEWMTRMNRKENILLEQEEQLNVITEISFVKDIDNKENRFLCHVDINTVFENQIFRFNYNSINNFVEKTLPIAKSIKQNFEVFD